MALALRRIRGVSRRRVDTRAELFRPGSGGQGGTQAVEPAPHESHRKRPAGVCLRVHRASYDASSALQASGGFGTRRGQRNDDHGRRGGHGGLFGSQQDAGVADVLGRTRVPFGPADDAVPNGQMQCEAVPAARLALWPWRLHVNHLGKNSAPGERGQSLGGD